MPENLTDAQKAVRQQIVDYGRRWNYSDTMIEAAVQTAWIESRLGANTTNSQSSAVGIFQYLSGTWNDFHSVLDRNNTEHQIQAFYTDISRWSIQYKSLNQPNVPDHIDLKEFIYIKHHDGNYYYNYDNAPGLEIWNNSTFPGLDLKQNHFDITDYDFRAWLKSNTSGPASEGQFMEEVQSLFLNPGVPESGFTSWVSNARSFISSIWSFLSENAGKLIDATVNSLKNIANKLKDTVDTAEWGYYDPIVIDLDGDGIRTISADENNARFDLFVEDGFSAKHGWLSGDDAFLALDINGNGFIDDISEMFGDRNTRGYAALAVYDENGDGKIDTLDAIFSDLRLWQDINQDGVSSLDEVFSLQDLDISSLSLLAEVVNEYDNRNLIMERSTVEFNDGRSVYSADVAFAAYFG